MRTLTALALSVALIGCVDAESYPDDNAPEVSLDGKGDGYSTPRGIYRDASADVGQFVRLEISANRTFKSELVVECATAPCPAQVNEGTVAFTGAGSSSYLRLTSRDGQLDDRYAYSMRDRELTLRVPNSAETQTLKRPAARCLGSAESCSRGDNSESTCESSEGCSFKEACTGYAASCSSMSQYDCGNQQGCYWLDLGDGNASCSGSTNSCSSESSEYSCEALRGCSWESDCAGSAKSCSSFDENSCSSQPGCHLE